MRWALIQGNKVANVVEQAEQPKVAGQWVACGTAGPGWSYDGSSFAPPPAPPVPPSVAVVEMAQAREALHAAGLLDDVEAAINAMAEPARTSARIAWEYRSTVRRDSALVTQLGAALGLSSDQIDGLFAAAALL